MQEERSRSPSLAIKNTRQVPAKTCSFLTSLCLCFFVAYLSWFLASVSRLHPVAFVYSIAIPQHSPVLRCNTVSSDLLHISATCRSQAALAHSGVIAMLVQPIAHVNMLRIASHVVVVLSPPSSATCTPPDCSMAVWWRTVGTTSVARSSLLHPCRPARNI